MIFTNATYLQENLHTTFLQEQEISGQAKQPAWEIALYFFRLDMFEKLQ